MNADLPEELPRWSPGPQRNGEDKAVIILSAKNLAIFATLISFAFTAGYNFREITSLKAEYALHADAENRIHDKFTLREVSDAQYQDIMRRLGYIESLVEQQMRDGKR